MQKPDQRNRPRRRRGHTTSVTIGGERFSLIATERADGTLGEVSIGCGKHGSGIAGLMDAYGTAISAGLQLGVPLADLLRPGLDLCFAPGGITDDPEIPRARSAVDYFSRRLAIDWLHDADRAALGVLTLDERSGRGSWAKAEASSFPTACGTGTRSPAGAGREGAQFGGAGEGAEGPSAPDSGRSSLASHRPLAAR